MTTDEVAERLGISTDRVRHYVKKGRLPMLRPGYAYRYRPADVEAFARIPRKTGVSIGPERGGAPKENFNALGKATGLTRNGKRLHTIRRHLPPKSRRIFDVAIIAAVRSTGGNTPHQRYIKRIRAIVRVCLATEKAWRAPAVTRAEQHRNLVVALKQWLELVGVTPDGEPVFDGLRLSK